LNQGITINKIEKSLLFAKEIFSSEELGKASLDGFQTHHCENLAQSSQETSLAFMKQLTIFPKSDFFAALNRSPRTYALESASMGGLKPLTLAMCEFLSREKVVHEHDKPAGGDYRTGGIWLFPDISFGQQNVFTNPTGYEFAWAQIVFGRGRYRVISDGDNWVQELHDLIQKGPVGPERTGGPVCQKRF
jgi:hypothetical protein